MFRALSWIAGAIGFAVCATAAALNTSQTPSGSNHLRAGLYASGVDINVGVLDTVFFGIVPENHLGSRLLTQLDFYGKTPSLPPTPLANPIDSHETLVADIIAGDDTLYLGVAPKASIVEAAIDDLNLDSRRAASAWLSSQLGINIFNLSASFGPNLNATNTESYYWDWFMREKNALLIAAAGNTGNQITIPADSYNGIAVGAYDEATQARWTSSAYTLNGGAAGTEVRGKPDILAPGVNITDGLSLFGNPLSGTSFAAPHVAGTAALLTEYGSNHPTTDTLDHRGLKALILNSARKRQIVGPELTSPVSHDSAAVSATFDKDYLSCGVGGCEINNALSPALSNTWTPSSWSYDGSKFTATKPLDDEQGVGFLDATRAIINAAGGNFGPGSVAGIGWDQDAITLEDSPAAHIYALNQTLSAGSFLTATLAWDRISVETDGDSIVEDADTYSFGELANLDLRLLNGANQVVAESISMTDNVEHLHIPFPANGSPGDYKLQVIYNGGGILATDFALAWWTNPNPLVPGDYNLDGTVNALDFEVWRTNFGTSTATLPLIYGDGNSDGLVDAADYTIWRGHLGQTWSPGAGAFAAVPEPSAIVISLLLGVVFTVRVKNS